MTNAPRFLQIHTLASYPATLLNRDDSGLAKRLPFGDASRTRISSQCLKRHWRTADDAWALKAIGSPMAVRSREIPERRLRPILDNAGVGSEETRAAAVKAMARLLYTPNKKDAPAVSDRQALLIGNTEIDHLAKGLIDIVRQHKEPAEVGKAIDAWFKVARETTCRRCWGRAAAQSRRGLKPRYSDGW
jgi:CRISPR system Cascade subunit CasC